MKATLQVAPEDCTGCGACVNICPAMDKVNAGKKAINLELQIPLRESEAANWAFFKKIPNTDSKLLNLSQAKGIAMREPLFEFSGCCAGCGETPYIKMMTQLFGDRALIANATGCSSIYGGNLPTTPYTKRADGKGPAWSNSLFEDAAEFGMATRVAEAFAADSPAGSTPAFFSASETAPMMALLVKEAPEMESTRRLCFATISFGSSVSALSAMPAVSCWSLTKILRMEVEFTVTSTVTGPFRP